MTRTYWLSFTDPTRPEGARFAGVCVVDVTDADAAAARRRMASSHPRAEAGAEWIMAAMTLAWAHDCNPGGEVASADITDAPETAWCPRNRLMQVDELAALGLIRARDGK